MLKMYNKYLSIAVSGLNSNVDKAVQAISILMAYMMNIRSSIVFFLPSDWTYWNWMFNNKELLSKNMSSEGYTLEQVEFLINSKEMMDTSPFDGNKPDNKKLDDKISSILKKCVPIIQEGQIFRPKYNILVDRDEIYAAYNGEIDSKNLQRITVSDKISNSIPLSIYKDEPESMDTYGFIAVHRVSIANYISLNINESNPHVVLPYVEYRKYLQNVNNVLNEIHVGRDIEESEKESVTEIEGIIVNNMTKQYYYTTDTILSLELLSHRIPGAQTEIMSELSKIYFVSE
jgi:hypothetical protein